MNADSCKTEADLASEELQFEREVDEWLKENGWDLIPTGERYILTQPNDLWVDMGATQYRLNGNDPDLHHDMGPVERAVLVARLRAEADALERNALYTTPLP